MPFITQQKTNWKFIGIVAVIAIIAGGCILNYHWWLEKQELKIPKPKISEEIDINKYLDEDAVLYGVDMPPEAEYQAISTNEAILIIAQSLEDQGVKDIKIRQLLWTVAPRGQFFIAGDCSFIQEDRHYNKFLAVINDGSEDEAGEPLFIFKDTDAWYVDLEYSGYLKELVGRYEVLAAIYNITPIFKSSEIENETADWQTYRNEEYGFEIKYPEDWYSRFTVTDISFDITNGNDISNSLKIRTPLVAAGSGFIDIPFDEDILISNNIPAKKKTELNQAGNYKWWRIIIQWRYKEGGVIIYDYPYEGVEGIDYLSLFDQMLSTFRFLE